MYHLDDLDMKIIREIDSPNSPRWKVRVSYGEISRKLGVDEETIRLRVKRARERGAFPTWRLMVSPHLLDCDQVSLELEVDAEERKPQAISQIRLVDGVTKIVNYRGKGLEVTLYSQGGASLARQVRRIESICGSRHSSLWTSRFPRPAVQLRKLDWKIVKALGDDVAGDLDEVATSLGVSTRTVQRRLQAMTEGKAVFLSGAPRVDAVGGVACCFVVFCPEGRGKGPLDATIRAEFGRVGHIDTSPEEYSHIGVPCENLGEADRLLKRLKAVDGVRDVSMHIMSEILLVQEWLGGEVDRRLSGD